jgi:hypothetical protein
VPEPSQDKKWDSKEVLALAEYLDSLPKTEIKKENMDNLVYNLNLKNESQDLETVTKRQLLQKLYQDFCKIRRKITQKNKRYSSFNAYLNLNTGKV